MSNAQSELATNTDIIEIYEYNTNIWWYTSRNTHKENLKLCHVMLYKTNVRKITATERNKFI